MVSRIFSVVLILLEPLMDEFTLMEVFYELLRVRGVDYRGYQNMFGGLVTVYSVIIYFNVYKRSIAILI